MLASGGLDSSTLLAFSLDQGIESSALFIDYGQAAAQAEAAAVAEICRHFSVRLQVVRHEGAHFGAGEIRGRNAFLLQTALMEFPMTSGTVMIGIHAGTGYRDCSPEFVDLMQRSYDFHAEGTISIAAPFVTWTKREIFHLAIELGVPIERTHSCEAADTSCGRCRSCLDRRTLAEETPRART